MVPIKQNALKKVHLHTLIISVFIWHSSLIGQHPLLSSETVLAKEPNSSKNYAPIYIALSIQWEGSSLKPYNLKMIKKVKKSIPGFPINHFISPAYFLKPAAKPLAARDIIGGTIDNIDTVGVHLSAWKSILDAAKVPLKRSSPTFWGDYLTESSCKSDCGDNIPLNAYDKADLKEIISVSLDTLKSQGYPTINSFVVKGWMVDEKVADIAARQGLKYDFSPISLHLIRKRINNYPIYQKLTSLWSHISPYTQPYRVQTTSQKEITAIAGGSAMVDYMSLDEIESLFKSYLGRKSANPDHPLVFHLGMYQETAYQYGSRFIYAIKRILAIASKHHVNIRPLQLDERLTETR